MRIQGWTGIIYLYQRKKKKEEMERKNEDSCRDLGTTAKPPALQDRREQTPENIQNNNCRKSPNSVRDINLQVQEDRQSPDPVNPEKLRLIIITFLGRNGNILEWQRETRHYV